MPKLQWGRNLTVAEGDLRARFDLDAFKLQWGRNLTVAEGGGPFPHFCAVKVSFNGAAT